MLSSTKWENYEQVARHLLEQFGSHFEIGLVEGKQLVPGSSGTTWELDAKALRKGSDTYLVVECRRYPKDRLKQKDLAALAFQISDVGAVGGIVVTPLELQAGAKAIAESNDIIHVTLSPESTTTDYFMRCMNWVCVGVSETLALRSSFTAKITRADGSTETRESEG